MRRCAECGDPLTDSERDRGYTICADCFRALDAAEDDDYEDDDYDDDGKDDYEPEGWRP